MKNRIVILSLLLSVFVAVNVNAQIKLPGGLSDIQNLVMPDNKDEFSKDILGVLNPGNDLGISAENMGKLETKNKSFLDDVLGIVGGSASDSDKLTQLGLKKKEKDDFVEKLLGKSTAGKYYSKVKTKLKPLQTKYKLAKLLM